MTDVPLPTGAPIFAFDGWLPEPLARTFSLGGPVVLVLALMSVVAFAIILFKSVELSILRFEGRRRVAEALELWQRDRREEALSMLAGARRGAARLVGIAMQGRVAAAHEPLVREELQRVAAADMRKLRSHLRTLEVIGQISPLLGLFGTVLGMIEAFRRMEEAGSRVDPSVLSGGIWQALLTTGVGLAVAIPVVLAHQWLERRADAHAHRIEDDITRVFTADLHPRVVRDPSGGTRGGRRAA